MRSPVLLTFWLCCILVSTATATTYVVRPDGTGDFPTIQAAIDGAENGDVIELVDGIYVGVFNRRMEYNGKSITIRSQSGNPEACIIDCEGSASQPEWGIRFDMGEGPQSVLEGVTVTNGWLTDSSSGAGIQFRSSSSPTIRNCRFTHHRAGSGAGAWVQGSAPTLIDCVFMGNTAVGEGAGLFCTDASPSLTDCSFDGNNAAGGGGAVASNFASAPTFTGCTFWNNTAFAGAVIRCDATSAPTFTGCTLHGNTGTGDGSIIFGRDDATITFESSMILSSPEGISVRCDQSAGVTLTCCDVYDNAGGDWVDCIAGQAGVDGNISVDPQFCSSTPAVDTYWALQNDSPCAPGNHPNGDDCGTIGAGAVECGTSAMQSRTWGAIKASYR